MNTECSVIHLSFTGVWIRNLRVENEIMLANAAGKTDLQGLLLLI